MSANRLTRYRSDNTPRAEEVKRSVHYISLTAATSFNSWRSNMGRKRAHRRVTGEGDN